MRGRVLLFCLTITLLFVAGCIETGPPREGIKLVASKQQLYDLNERNVRIEVELQNNSGQTIFFEKPLVCLPPTILVYKKNAANQFEKISQYVQPNNAHCGWIEMAFYPIEELVSNKTTTIQWNVSKIFDNQANELPVSGTYKVILQYAKEKTQERLKNQLKPPLLTVESNEFEIQEDAQSGGPETNPIPAFCKSEGGTYTPETIYDGNCSFGSITCKATDFRLGKACQEFTSCKKAGFEVQNIQGTAYGYQYDYGLCMVEDTNCLLEEFQDGNCQGPPYP